MADLNDPSLGLIKRTILTKAKAVLGQPLLKEVLDHRLGDDWRIKQGSTEHGAWRNSEPGSEFPALQEWIPMANEDPLMSQDEIERLFSQPKDRRRRAPGDTPRPL